MGVTPTLSKKKKISCRPLSWARVTVLLSAVTTVASLAPTLAQWFLMGP